MINPWREFKSDGYNGWAYEHKEFDGVVLEIDGRYYWKVLKYDKVNDSYEELGEGVRFILSESQDLVITRITLDLVEKFIERG